MSRFLPRPAAAALVAAASLLAAACGHGGSKAPRGCQADPDCGGAGRCVAGLCQASARPVADFTVPAGLVTQRETTLASTARDPDPGDAIAAWSWTAAAAGAACEPELSGADGPSPLLVFWCPGTYRIGLTVTDSSETESEPVERTVEVAANTMAPSVSAAGEALVHHRCAGEPLRCALAEPLALSAAGSAAGGGTVTYRWSVVPPDAARSAASAVFAPSDAAASTALQLGLAGTGIVGRWAVQVRVRDEAGNVAVARRAFEVGNRPPLLRAAASGGAEVPLDHTVGDCPSGGGRCYLASGAEAFLVEDPDGDPVSAVTISADASGAGAGAFAEVGVGGQASAFRFGAPLGNPAAFRAADGSSGFHLTGTVADVHGAAAALTLRARIGNRPPVALWWPTPVSTPHTWSPAAGAYLATTAVASFTDPDGDPIVESGSTGDAICGAFSASGGTVSATCRLDFTPAAGRASPLASFLAPHAVTPRMTDGWASGERPTVIAIENRAPAVAAYAGVGYGCACACTRWWTSTEPGATPECLTAAMAAGPVTRYPVSATASASDPDGDPLDVAVTYFDTSADVVASDGVGSTTRTWTATSVVCETKGAACTL